MKVSTQNSFAQLKLLMDIADNVSRVTKAIITILFNQLILLILPLYAIYLAF